MSSPQTDNLERESWHKTRLEDVPDAVDKILAHADKQVSVMVREARVKPNNPFSLVFHEVLSDLILAQKIGLLELRILLSLLKFAGIGNFISITQAEVANDLKINRSSVCRGWAKLELHKILLKTQRGSVFINPQVACRSSMKKMQKSEAYKLSKQTNFENF